MPKLFFRFLIHWRKTDVAGGSFHSLQIVPFCQSMAHRSFISTAREPVQWGHYWKGQKWSPWGFILTMGKSPRGILLHCATNFGNAEGRGRHWSIQLNPTPPGDRGRILKNAVLPTEEWRVGSTSTSLTGGRDRPWFCARPELVRAKFFNKHFWTQKPRETHPASTKMVGMLSTGRWMSNNAVILVNCMIFCCSRSNNQLFFYLSELETACL